MLSRDPIYIFSAEPSGPAMDSTEYADSQLRSELCLTEIGPVEGAVEGTEVVRGRKM